MGSHTDGATESNDDALLARQGWADVGVVARDSQVKVLLAATRKRRTSWPVEIAEYCKL